MTTKQKRRAAFEWLKEQGFADGGTYRKPTLSSAGRAFLLVHIWQTLGRPGYPDPDPDAGWPII